MIYKIVICDIVNTMKGSDPGGSRNYLPFLTRLLN